MSPAKIHAPPAWHGTSPGWEQIVLSSPAAVLVFDAEHRYVAANDAACALTGYSREELLTMRAGDFAADSFLPYFSAFMARLDADGLVDVVPLLKRKDGTAIEVALRVVRITPDCHAVTAWDLTRYRQAERALGSAELRLEWLLRQAPSFAWTTDETLTIRSMAGSAYTRQTLDTFVGREVGGFAEGAFAPAAAHERAMTGESVSCEFAMGDRRFTAHLDPIRRAAGAAQGVLGTAVDVTRYRYRETERWRVVTDGRADAPAGIERTRLNARNAAGAALAQLARLVPMTRGSVLLVEDDRARVLAARAPDTSALAPGCAIAITGSIADAPLVTRLGGPSAASALERRLYAEGVRQLLLCPMHVDGRAIGLVEISRGASPPFSNDEMQVAGNVANGLAMTLDTAMAFEQIGEANARLAAVSRRLVQVQEAERAGLARELHDEIGQLLTGLKLGLGLARDRPERAALVDAERLVDEILGRLRHLTITLRPPILDELGLNAALLWLFERYTLQTKVRVDFSQHGLDGRLPREVETAAYRVTQEALTNVARHARTWQAFVEIVADAARLTVSVRDCGCGFDAETAGRESRGLAGMRERIALIGGSLTVTSERSHGTTVAAVLPLTLEAGLP